MIKKIRRGVTPKYKLKYTIKNVDTGEFVLHNRKFNMRVWDLDLGIAIAELDSQLDRLYQMYCVNNTPKTTKAKKLGIKIAQYIKPFL